MNQVQLIKSPRVTKIKSTLLSLSKIKSASDKSNWKISSTDLKKLNMSHLNLKNSYTKITPNQRTLSKDS
jgi:hypothetical protein